MQKNIPLVREMAALLEDEYFSYLDESGEQYLVHHTVSNDPPHTLSDIKPEYDITHDEMAKVLDYSDFADYIRVKLLARGIVQPKWISDWTRDMIGGTR